MRAATRAPTLATAAEKGTAISKPSIARSTAMMSTLTLVSRITGLLRAWTMAVVLGLSVLGAAYSVCNNIPNMIFEFVAGGIISSLFIPTFMEIREQKSEGEAWAFTSHIFNLAVLSLLVIGVIGTVFPGPFVWTQTFTLKPADAAAVAPVSAFLFRFFALQVVLYGAGAIISALLNSQREYFWPAVGPIFNNVVAIAAMIAFAALGGKLTGPGMTQGLAPIVLAGGTTLAVVVMFAVQVPAVLRTGWRWSPGLGLHDPAIRKLMKLAVPTLIYVATNMVAVSFRNSTAYGARPDHAGPAILTYAWMWYQLPYGILAVALATAVFTELAEAAGRRDFDEFRSTFARGLRATGVLILPTSAVLVALATPLIRLFRFGAFTDADIPLVAGALRWWAGGLVFYAATMFLLRTFYSLKDTYTPMIWNLGLTFLVQVPLYWVLTTGIGGWKGLGVDGIPIADAVFYASIAFALAWVLFKRIGDFDARGVVLTYGRMAVASVSGALVTWGIILLLGQFVSGVGGALIQIATGGIIGLLVAMGLGRLLGVAEVAFATELVTRVISRRGGRS